jgi:hypothetical protein
MATRAILLLFGAACVAATFTAFMTFAGVAWAFACFSEPKRPH